jgi:hypothetical protein
MSRTVQIQGDRAVFPGNACVNCLRPATQQVEIVKVRGHVVRKVRVPFCDECLALRQKKSPKQCLFERAALVNSTLLALAVGGWVYLTISSDLAFGGEQRWMWACLVGLLVALIVFGTMCLIMEPWSRCFRSPETQRALGVVTIKEFDWETTTLQFANDEYAERFAQVNVMPQE